MEINFSKLKQKDVISLTDGKNLGKICDATIDIKKYDVLGFFATGGKGFRFNKKEVFIPVDSIEKVGEDTILVNVDEKDECDKKPSKPNKGRRPDCRPDCPPQAPCPPPRRSLDEYE